MNSQENWKALPRDEVVRAVERRGPRRRIPLVLHKWWSPEWEAEAGERLGEFDAYPDDVEFLFAGVLPYQHMGLSWCDENVAEGMVLTDWSQLDELIEKLPDPAADPVFEKRLEQANAAHAEDRYILFGWWNLFFEHACQLRGVSNLMMDPYMNPEELGRLLDALAAHYQAWIARAVEVLKPDGFFTGDDIGQQSGTLIPPDLFREHFKPRYVQLGRFLDDQRLHWWMHSCGDNREILADYVEVGVDVLHPVQSDILDGTEVVRQWGDQLSFAAGIDVAQILRNCRPEAIEAETERLIREFDRPEGGLILALGNNVMEGTPPESVHAFLRHALQCGEKQRARFAQGDGA